VCYDFTGSFEREPRQSLAPRLRSSARCRSPPGTTSAIPGRILLKLSTPSRSIQTTLAKVPLLAYVPVQAKELGWAKWLMRGVRSVARHTTHHKHAHQGRAKPAVPAALATKTRDELLAMLLDALKKLKQRDRRIEERSSAAATDGGTSSTTAVEQLEQLTA